MLLVALLGGLGGDERSEVGVVEVVVVIGVLD